MNSCLPTLRRPIGAVLAALVMAAGGRAQPVERAELAAPVAALLGEEEEYPRPAATWFEAQVELARRGFSGGPIDGIPGPRSRAALEAFQRREGLAATGDLDGPTREQLPLAGPALVWASLAAEDFAELQPLATTWLGKSQQSALAHETALELAAERFRAGAAFLRRINSDVEWDALAPEHALSRPGGRVYRPAWPGRPNRNSSRESGARSVRRARTGDCAFSGERGAEGRKAAGG